MIDILPLGTWIYQREPNTGFSIWVHDGEGGLEYIVKVIREASADFICEKMNADHEYRLIGLGEGIKRLLAEHYK